MAINMILLLAWMYSFELYIFKDFYSVFEGIDVGLKNGRSEIGFIQSE